MKAQPWIALAVLLTLIVGCGGSEDGEAAAAALAATPDAGLPLGVWDAKTVDGQPALPDMRMTIEDGRLAGGSGCNRFTTSWKADGDALELGPTATTRRACAPPRMEVEDRFLAALSRVRGWRVEAGILQLTDETRAVLIEYQQPQSPPLDGKVQGKIFHTEAVQLPATAVAVVKLVDVSKADVAADVIAEQRIEPAGQVPIEYVLEYDPARIDPASTYAVQARITDGDTLLYVTDTVYQVLTRGNGGTQDVLVVKVVGPED